MDKITLRNYRCFREEQSVRLAPLTFLVGGNSTGKTSFMALIRALWDVAFREEVPDFRETPYNLGSFREIVHSRGGRGGQAQTFEAGFEHPKNRGSGYVSFQAVFEERSANPFPVVRCFGQGETRVKVSDRGDGRYRVKMSAPDAQEHSFPDINVNPRDETRLVSLASLVLHSQNSGADNSDEESLKRFRAFAATFRSTLSIKGGRGRPFASAPVRSRPLRTYDPARPWIDPEGEYIPTYLASMYHRDPDGWQTLKNKLEDFGHASGLFDEISIKSFARHEGAPFQVQVRKFAEKGGRKGPPRNLIDVGYGVSQALPLLTELLREDSSSMFLLQQPEVHLHPSAQAALGSLFCAIAGSERQLIVETHSDYIVDRVCMDIRDKATGLKPEDVSILYFEPGDLEVKIHSIRLDEYGNILDAPASYGKFFMEEVRRSTGIGL